MASHQCDKGDENITVELRSDISKNDLADALVLLLQKKEYRKISIQDIVDRAGLSRMAYYRNFESKDDILRFYLDKITDRFIEETQIDYDTLELSEYITILFTHLERWADFCKLLLKYDLLHFVKNEFDRIFKAKAKNFDEQYTYSFIAGGLFNVFNQWLIRDCKETPAELAQIFKRTLMG